MLRRKYKTSYVLAVLSFSVLASEVPTGDPAKALTAVEVRAKTEDVLGIVAAGSEGVVAKERVEALPLLRPAEVLELVPGMMATSIRATARPTSTSCAASTSTTAPTSVPPWPVCR